MAGGHTKFINVGKLALRDMLHETILTLCLILAVAAVLTPIILLAAVKFGFIDSLRRDLIADPTFREIRPSAADLRQVAFFDEVASWEGVRYVVPSVMLTPREVTIEVEKDGKRDRDRVRLMPSGITDPFMEKLVGSPPAGDSIVATANFLEQYGLDLGAHVELVIERIVGDARQRQTMTATIGGVVPAETQPQPTLFGDSQLDSDVESYRAGVAVPGRSWPGVMQVPVQAYDAIVVSFDGPPGERVLSDLRIKVGAPTITELNAVQVVEQFSLGASNAAGWHVSHGTNFIVLENRGETYSGRDLQTAQAIADDRAGRAYGYARPGAGSVTGTELVFQGVWTDLFRPATPLATVWTYNQNAAFKQINGVLMPETMRETIVTSGSDRVTASFHGEATSSTPELELPLRVTGYHAGDEVLVNPALLAMVARGRDIKLAYDSVNQSLAELSSGYRGFRMIAETLEDVPILADRLVAKGVPVQARSDAIVRLQRLDRSLDILVAMVAGVALIGGWAVLSSNFFANVQRKSRDIAMFRLVGLSRSSVFMFPVFQSIVIAFTGFLFSLMFYWAASWVLNTFVVGELGFKGELARLTPEIIATFFLVTIIGALISSLFAARATTRIDPAEAVRNE